MENEIYIQDEQAGGWLHFQAPRQLLTAYRLDEVRPALAAAAAATRAGHYAAGFVAYEAAPAFDPALTVPPAGALPLLWLGIYAAPARLAKLPAGAGPYTVGAWQPDTSPADYGAAIAHIHDQIAAGRTYQVNYTLRLRAPFQGDAFTFFGDISAAQAGSYSAFVDTGRFAIASASPELFFRLDGVTLTTQPMKGTAARGLTLAEDEAQAAWLRGSAKNRAENVMIVDMIRNDLGRVARTGSVQVTDLFQVRRFPTLWQMTSTVRAESDAAPDDLFAALFPCASITGAPKVSTMGIIRDLEAAPRGVYTGAIGYFAPERRAQFNVAIRTVVVDRQRGMAEYGVGSGIVWDSDAAAEYAECQTKAQVLTTRWPDFELLESLLWEPGAGYFLYQRHLDRLAAAATYFNYPLDLAALRRRLDGLALTAASKVRVCVAGDGALSVTAAPAGVLPPARVGLAAQPVSARDPFLYFKTTRRQAYESARAGRPDCDDVILWNEQGELTEAGSANIVLEIGGRYLTPPVSSGLLAGTFRAELLAGAEIEEAVLTPADLGRAERIWLINSVRRWRPAVFIAAATAVPA